MTLFKACTLSYILAMFSLLLSMLSTIVYKPACLTFIGLGLTFGLLMIIFMALDIIVDGDF